MDSEELSDYPENGLVNDMSYAGEEGLGDTSQLSNTQTTPGMNQSNNRRMDDDGTNNNTEKLRHFMEEAQPGATPSQDPSAQKLP